VRRNPHILLLAVALALTSMHVDATGNGKLLGTGGLTSIDGAAGGGLVPWAVIGGHAETGEWDASAALTYVDTGDFDLQTGAVAVGWSDRLELSVARMSLGLDALMRTGSAPDVRLETDVYGVKVRLAGDLIYGDWPQLSAGVQWRRSHDQALIAAAGADDDQGFDVYLAGSRLWLDGIAGRRTLANLTLRSTAANQLGLLGFSDQRSLTVEGSLAVFLSRTLAIGAEYRDKPDALAFAPEDPWMDLFVAWFPNKNWHFTLAYVDLGSVGGVSDQRGYYLSIQGSP
jgi:hypothetical protein